jgi:hypothetical protein
MKKRILIFSMTVLTLVVITLPMIPTAQAKKGGIPTENYQDLQIWGFVLPDSTVEINANGKMQYGTYTVKSYNNMMKSAEWIAIFWNGQPFVDAAMLSGTASGILEYKINTDTGMGVAHVSFVITVPGGTFEGDMVLVGEFDLNADNTLNVVKVMWHAVYDGTGDYEGWRIVTNNNGRPSWSVPPFFAGSSHLVKPES